MTIDEATPALAPDSGGFAGRALGWVERAGNRVPDPAILFIALIVFVIALSQVLYSANVGVPSKVADAPAAQADYTKDSYDNPGAHGTDYAVKSERVQVKGLLTGDGIRFIFTKFVSNFLGFVAVGVILVAMSANPNGLETLMIVNSWSESPTAKVV